MSKAANNSVPLISMFSAPQGRQKRFRPLDKRTADNNKIIATQLLAQTSELIIIIIVIYFFVYTKKSS